MSGELVDTTDTVYTRPMTPGDVDSIRGIWRTRFGSWSDADDELLEAAQASDEPVRVHIAVRDGFTVGFGMALVSNTDWVPKYFGEYLDSFPERPGLIHMLAVRAGEDGNGIGTRLARAQVAYLRDKYADAAYAVSWRKPGHDSADVFEKLGFTNLETVEDFYVGHRGHCPRCGEECHCDASFYRLRLGGSTDV